MKLNKKALLGTIVILFSTHIFAQNTNTAIDTAKLNDYLTRVNKAYHIPGMAFYITTPNSTLFENTYGQCTDFDQLFFIGSESKSFTALCIMQLVEQGKVSLDDDITKYLNEYQFSKTVTVRDLLNQTSGFGTHMKLFNVKVESHYGTYEYANVNYDLLGKIIEKASGTSYAQYVSEHIFKPLEMEHSSADAASVKGNPTLLKGNRNWFGIFIRGDADYPQANSWFHESAGFIATTPRNQQNYLRMYLNDGRAPDGTSIISKESIQSMWYDNVPIDKENSARYGMGWNYMNYDGATIIFHGGQVENYITYMFILPQKQIAVSFMINGNDEFGMNALMDKVFWDSLAIIYAQEPKKINTFAYTGIHLLLDLLYLAMITLSVITLVAALRKNAKPRKKAQSIALSIICYVLWPILLLSFTRQFFATPLWVVKSYVPDLFFVIMISVAISLAGGITKLIRRIRHSHRD